jgi:hypothetical protein
MFVCPTTEEENRRQIQQKRLNFLSRSISLVSFQQRMDKNIEMRSERGTVVTIIVLSDDPE